MDPLPFPFFTLMQSDSTSDACWLAASFQTRCSTSKGPLTLSSRSRVLGSRFTAGRECRWIDRMRFVLLPPFVVAASDDAILRASDWVGNTTNAAQAISRTTRSHWRSVGYSGLFLMDREGTAVPSGKGDVGCQATQRNLLCCCDLLALSIVGKPKSLKACRHPVRVAPNGGLKAVV